MSNIAIVVPTIRRAEYAQFAEAWTPLLVRYQAELLTICDGDVPLLSCNGAAFTPEDVLGDDADLIFHRTDACRNLGFAYIARFMPDIEYIITLDDDTRPNGDTIQDHLRVLNLRVCKSWMTTMDNRLMTMPRGFPYSVREEARVVVSHGVWHGVPDFDGQTQLAHPITDYAGPFYVGPVPQGIHVPFCGMNVGFRREMLPDMYYAPMGPRAGYHRWADILLGYALTRRLEFGDRCLYTGGASVLHQRASDPIKNREIEQDSINLGEHLNAHAQYKTTPHDTYFGLWEECYGRWIKWVSAQEAKP